MRKTPHFQLLCKEKYHYGPFLPTWVCKVYFQKDIVCKLGSNCIYLHIVYTAQHFFNPTELSYTKAISADYLRTYLVTASTGWISLMYTVTLTIEHVTLLRGVFSWDFFQTVICQLKKYPLWNRHFSYKL